MKATTLIRRLQPIQPIDRPLELLLAGDTPSRVFFKCVMRSLGAVAPSWGSTFLFALTLNFIKPRPSKSLNYINNENGPFFLGLYTERLTGGYCR